MEVGCEGIFPPPGAAGATFRRFFRAPELSPMPPSAAWPSVSLLAGKGLRATAVFKSPLFPFESSVNIVEEVSSFCERGFERRSACTSQIASPAVPIDTSINAREPAVSLRSSLSNFERGNVSSKLSFEYSPLLFIRRFMPIRLGFVYFRSPWIVLGAPIGV